MDIKIVEDEVMLSDGRIIKMPVKRKEDENEKDKAKAKLKVEKIPNVWGSSAGAGSDYFDLYRKQRNEENERLEIIEKQWKEYTDNQIFQSKRREKIEYIEKKRQKKKNKRLMKKNKIKQLRINKKINKNEKKAKMSSSDENEEKCTDTDRGSGRRKDKQHVYEEMDGAADGGVDEEEIQFSKRYDNNNNRSPNKDGATANEDPSTLKGKKKETETDDKNELCVPPVDLNNFLVVKEDELF
ncbi:hypothetical protein MKS88_001470 [Plasmodium brasilianum]|uniref:Uncharacterized protein n=2 Tax=Plasmodium (Plasmodium) TaxID=418103 RepID=A0A1A8WW49_PLAMA|nr:conserved Plasmodium protein, unknown function [Plasmodium malariae]KAI4840112.1 hypothetical protein MKS88_001470 [Plasmodium brasilianum]SBS96105.1 conserved protein, unknown function [Plasmodium malariae]SBT87475.1 conserved Plasmodium protein, unknown function [Plasmodium malariae]